MKINDADNIYYGDIRNTSIDAIYIGSVKIWPTGYVWELIPTWNQNLITYVIPANGGNVQATWTLVGKQNGITVYSNTVVPTSSTVSHNDFSYSTNNNIGIWTANNRGANGYVDYSTEALTEEQRTGPARSCTLTVSYTGTVTVNSQSVLVSVASAQQTLNQAANPATEGSWSYHNCTITLNNYSSSSSPVPAWGGNTTATTSGRAYVTYTWASSAVRHRDRELSAFSLSCSAGWVSINNTTKKITVPSRGTTTGNLRSASIVSSVSGTAVASVTIYQQENAIVSTESATCSTLYIDHFEKDSSTITRISDCKSSTVIVVARASYTEAKTIYTAYNNGSGDPNAYTGGTSHINDVVTPSSLSVTGADVTTTSSFTVKNIHNTSNKTWTVQITYINTNASDDIIQNGDSVKNVNVYHVSLSNISNNLTTAGGTVTFDTSAYHTINSCWNSDDALISEGTTIYSDTVYTNDISLDTSGSTANNASYRFGHTTTQVSHQSMKKNAGYDKVKITLVHHSDSTVKTSSSVYSSPENIRTPVSASCSNITVSSLPSTENSCLEKTITSAVVKATWTESGYKWTAYDEGDTSAHEGMTLHSNVRVYGSDGVSMLVDGVEFADTTTFSINNKYNESWYTHSIKAKFIGTESSSYSISQGPDSKSSWYSRGWTITNISLSGDIWAGGGQASVLCTAKHEEYKQWTSDNTEVDNKYETDVPTFYLVDSSNNQYTGNAFSLSNSTLSHVDMENNSRTDTVKVKIINNTAVDYTNLVSITNNRATEPSAYSQYHDYGSSYNGNYRMDSFTVNNSSFSFKGGSSSYSASACHDLLQPLARDVYYYYDSNYASLHGGSDHNDANHRYTVANGDTNVSPRIVSTDYNDTVIFTYSTGANAWISINTSQNKIIISPQSNLGDASRYGYVYAENSNGGNSTGIQINQTAYAGFSVSPLTLWFDPSGGTDTINIDSYYTDWKITYVLPRPTDPAARFNPNQYTDNSAHHQETVSCTVESFDSQGTDGPTIGIATIQPITANSDIDNVVVQVRQLMSSN